MLRAPADVGRGARRAATYVSEGAHRVDAYHGFRNPEVLAMSVYKVIEVIGTSTKSWEDAAASAVAKARETLRDLRVAEVSKQDLDIADDGALTYRTKLSVSFKYEDG